MSTPSVETPDFDPTLFDQTGEATKNKYAEYTLVETRSGDSSFYKTEGEMFKRPKGGRPIFIDPRFLGKNGFYSNGPTFNPLAEAEARQNAIQAYTQSWSKPEQKDYLDRFASLVSTYGNTNSAGVLTGLAQSGLDPKTAAVQGVLKADAAANAANIGANKPAIATMAATDSEENWFQNLMQPVEFLARNSFQLLNAPFQAIDASIRTVGGGIAAIVGDEEARQRYAKSVQGGGLFAQTDIGQTIKSTFFNPTTGEFDFDPWSALNQYQAGLDVNRAMEELQADPAMAPLLNNPQDSAKVMKMAEDLAKKNEWYVEPGWFVDETSEIGEAQRRSTYDAWAIPGPNDQLTAWTLGRGIAGATVGPDSSAYSAMSGVIDATWNIVGDPLTYAGGAGLVSKGVQAVSKGISGGENVIRIGKVGREWRAMIGAKNASNAKTVDEYNNFARLNGIKEITAAQFAGLEVAEQVDVVKGAQKGNATQEALDNVGLNTDVIQNSIADLRRAAAVRDKVSGISTRVEDVDGLRTSRDLYTDFVNSVKKYSPEGVALWDMRKVADWQAANGEEAMSQINDYVALRNAWKESQAEPLTDKQAYEGFNKFINGIIDANEGKPISGNAAKALADATTSALDGTAVDIAAFGDDLPLGAVLSAYTPGMPMQGIMNGSRVMAYADDATEFVIRGGDELIDDSVKTNLMDSLLRVLDDPRLNKSPIVADLEDVGKLSGITADRINESDNARAVIQGLFSDPTITYGGALQVITRLGLDGYLDDFLRKNGIDGVSDGPQSGNRGTWLGEHPALEAYRVPDDLADIAEQAVQSGDPQTFLASLSKGDRVDMHGMSTTDALIFALKQDQKYQEIVEGSRLLDVTLLEKARIGQTKLQKAIEGIDEAFLDPAEGIRGVMSHEAGMRLLNGQGTLDAAGVRNFLFGYGPSSKMAQKTLETLSGFLSKDEIAKVIKEDGTVDQVAYEALQLEWLGKLERVTNGKWTHDTIKQVFDNALYERGVDGLIDTLAPRLGIDVSQGSISKTVAVLGTDGLRDFNKWNTMQPFVKRIAYNAMRTPDYLGRLRPGSSPVEILNSDQIAQKVREYGNFIGLGDDVIDKYVSRVIMGAGKFETGAVNRNVLTDMFNDIAVKIVDDLDESIWFKNGRREKQKEAVKQAIMYNTRIYIGGKTDSGVEYADYIGRNGDNTVDTVIFGDGNVEYMPNFMIDSELATGMVNLPGVEDLMSATTRLGRALSVLPKGTDGFDVSKKFYDNFFRTALLVGRGAYILRNSAEMQVRMFLNGHQSIFNSPATMIGMTIGNQIARNLDPNSLLAKTIAPYRHTILGTDFEVGVDAERAAANYTSQYFNMIRMSHSLTDQRLYNSGVRGGWKPLGVNAAQFNQGWAHELIMLHNSGLAKLVLKADPAVYPGKTNSGQQWDAIIDEFLSDAPEMVRLRQIMIAGSDQYARMFGDRVALRNYFFEADNSILDRVNTFTYNDPDLKQFVLTGQYAVGDITYNINEITKLPNRVKDLAFMLKKQFRSNEADNANIVQHFDSKQVKVPWSEKGDGAQGNFLVNKFFDISNSFERLGSVGPEYRMSYWDKIEELAPAINADDIDEALEAARTTLGVIQRLSKNDILENIGKNHGVYAALKRVKKSGDNGNLSLMEVHEIAAKYAAEATANLFYDAARRNDTWASLRLLFPFGQAWGNTLKTWGELGKKNPLQVYKIQKVLNGAQQEGSSAIYDMLDSFGMYPDYAPGGAPYDQDASGGFFYQDQQGSTKFMLPFAGALTAAPLKVWGAMSGIDTPSDIGVESPVQSLNFALGADSLLPGVSAFAASALNLFPDNQVVQQAKAAVAPFGSQSITEAALAPWLQNMIAGSGSIPIVGGAVENFVGALAPQRKNKYIADAMTYLASTGKYNMTDPMQVDRLAADAKSLGGALLLTGGLFQNLSPASPQFQVGFDAKKNLGDMTQDTGHYAISMMNMLKQGYLARNGNDTTEANLDMVQDFGPTALLALVGDWKGMERMPTSEALAFAYKNPDIAKAYNGQFQYFFPGGDSSDIQAREWAERNASTEATRKSADEIANEYISWMIRVQRARLDSMFASGGLDEAKYDAAIDDLEERYKGTMPASTIRVLDKTDEMNKFKYMYDNTAEIKNSKAGLVFAQAWSYRDQALQQARSLTGRESTTLNGKKTAAIRDAYVLDIDTLIAQHPEFKLLGLKFKREFS
jgi:hypothetical protein